MAGAILGLLRVKPQHPVGPGGEMPLADHLRELRARLLRSLLALVVAFGVALPLYDPYLLNLILDPYRQALVTLGSHHPSEVYVSGVGGGLMLQLKLCGVAAIVGSSPVWLYQLWAFIVPGMRRTEKVWTLVFVAVAGPLFLAGVALGYYVMPKGLSVLIGFVPQGLQNLNNFDDFFSFITRMLLVFGISLEIPLFVVLLNLAGVLKGRTLGRYRPWIVVGTFVFAAVATPSTDPFSMTLLAVPMIVLFGISEAIARLVDRRRERRAGVTRDLSPDEASPL